MMSDFEMYMDEYLPLRDVVFNTLRRAILKGELKPGERLMEMDLANRLGVSRTPIREAIHKLELEGLAVMIPRKGAKVASITIRDLKDVLEVRKGLEELAVKLACERISTDEIQKLKKFSNQFQFAMKTDNLAGLAESDVEFHEIIYHATDNPRLVQILNNLREQMYRYRIEYLKDSTARKTLAIEHEAIWTAVKERNKEKAVENIRNHIDNQQKAIIRSLEGKE